MHSTLFKITDFTAFLILFISQRFEYFSICSHGTVKCLNIKVNNGFRQFIYALVWLDFILLIMRLKTGGSIQSSSLLKLVCLFISIASQIISSQRYSSFNHYRDASMFFCKDLKFINSIIIFGLVQNIVTVFSLFLKYFTSAMWYFIFLLFF